MRPDTKTKLKGNAGAEARARMYIRRDLGWLEGFPGEGNTWVVAPLGGAVSVMTLDRELLHRSTRTIHMLVREFPKALPRLVGDVGVWAERRKTLIERVKPSVHDGVSLPDAPTDDHPLATKSLKRKVASARRELSGLSSVVTTFEWSGWTAPEGVHASLAWLHENKRPLAELLSRTTGSADVLCFRLWQLSQEHGQKRVTPIMRFLAQPALWAVPLECEGHYIRVHSAWVAKRKKEPRSALPARRSAGLPAAIIEWVLWLATEDARTQRKGLELFALLVESCDASRWASWWERFDHVLKDASRLPQEQIKKQGRSMRHALVARLEGLSDETPPALPTKALAELLRELPSQEQDGLWQSLMSGLGHWPAIHEGAAIRVALSRQWLSVWSYSTRPERAALLRFVAAFHAYARDVSFEADTLIPWAGICRRMQGKRSDHRDIDYDIVEKLSSAEKLATFFRILRETPATAGAQAQLLVGLCATFPAGDVAAAYVALRESPVAEKYIPDSALTVAATIGGKGAAHLPKLLMALTQDPHRYDDLGPSLKALEVLFEEGGLPGLVLAEIEQGRLNAVALAASKHKLVLREGGTIPKVRRYSLNEDRDRSWAERYPEELQPALARLSEFDEHAPKTAQRILAKDFPDPASLRRELAELEDVEGANGDEAQSERRRRRVRSLRSRLNSPASPSSRRLARLGSKLSATAELKALHGWYAALGEAYQDAVVRYLGVTAAAAWLEDERVVRTLLSLTNLESEFQTLAKTMLRARTGDEPWDLRDEPRNRAFIERMEQQGVRSDVWLDRRSRVATTNDGRNLTLSLERDPLEVFQMGGHFNTCLSPGAFNYFSAIANAADINKQVLFARDSEGRVFGRQLLALTDDGGLLAFHCYAHSQNTGFRDLAKDFVTNFADDLRTLVVASGRVSTLVAPRWYDDGPVDFAGEHPALMEGSRFRQRLKKIDARRFLSETTAALSPLPLNELTLPRVITLPELSERPELLVLLMPLARKTALPVSTLVAFVRGTLHADGLSADSAARWVHEAALRQPIIHDHWPYGAAELLVELDPVRALDLLKQTRSKDIRRWTDDWDGRRLRLVAQANERLHRRNKAIKFYRLALAAVPNAAFERECRAEIERLEAGGL